MKRTIWIGVLIIAAVAIAWVGRAAWRAHKKIVTLHVKNATVAEVVRKLERLTFETIIADTNLDARVTLNLKNVPLQEALDRLAEQAGGLAGVCHAVYRSSYGLHRLETALNRGAVNCDGWTNLAPHTALGISDNLQPGNFSQAPGRVVISSSKPDEIAKALKSRTVGSQITVQSQPIVITSGSDATNFPKEVQAALHQALGARGSNAIAHSTRVIRLRDGTNTWTSESSSTELPNGAIEAIQQALEGQGNSKVSVHSSKPMITIRSQKPGANGDEPEMEEWSPERLAMEENLVPKLGDDSTLQATRSCAEALARKIQAKATTLYAIKKSPIGLAGFGTFPKFNRLLAGGSPGTGTNAAQLLNDLENRVRRQQAEQYLKLTPEQRALRARAARQAGKTN